MRRQRKNRTHSLRRGSARTKTVFMVTTEFRLDPPPPILLLLFEFNPCFHVSTRCCPILPPKCRSTRPHYRHYRSALFFYLSWSTTQHPSFHTVFMATLSISAYPEKHLYSITYSKSIPLSLNFQYVLLWLLVLVRFILFLRRTK